MYDKILVGIDGSLMSDLAGEAALSLAEKSGAELLPAHVYAKEMHKKRFQDMEPGLPSRYQSEAEISRLRGTHEDIIGEGMKVISDSYLSPLVRSAQDRKIAVRPLTPEGRNYVEFLRLMDAERPGITILGANGQGNTPDSRLGGMVLRTLWHDTSSDVMVIRNALRLKGGTIVVGVDGSQNSYHALQKAVQMAKMFGAQVEAVAIYDPFFHTGVFRSISQALDDESQKKFNFKAQERLHDEIIDDGLASLYLEGLERGVRMIGDTTVPIKLNVIPGKPFSQLSHFVSLKNAGLLVLGKFGSHRERDAVIGSTIFNACLISQTNVLMVQPPKVPLEIPSLPEEKTEIAWTPEALLRIERIPDFARPMAMKTIERKARERNMTSIEVKFVDELADLMGTSAQGSVVSVEMVARKVVLKKIKKLAPGFHEAMARSKLDGAVVTKGDRILVYEVLSTEPDGLVRVGKGTILEFI